MASPTVVIRLRGIIKEYPILKGMLTYTVLWPTSNLCQQAIQGREQLSFKEAARFCMFGTFLVAPSLYTWVKIAGRWFPGNSVQVAVKKALVEQFAYSPFAISMFYGGMTLLEGKTFEDAKSEIQAKFLPTYKTGVCIWPIVQTVNFAFIKERNRVAVTGVVSFFWTVFLSYMKQKQFEKETKERNAPSIMIN